MSEKRNSRREKYVGLLYVRKTLPNCLLKTRLVACLQKLFLKFLKIKMLV